MLSPEGLPLCLRVYYKRLFNMWLNMKPKKKIFFSSCLCAHLLSLVAPELAAMFILHQKRTLKMLVLKKKFSVKRFPKCFAPIEIWQKTESLFFCFFKIF